jgi:hypothetical protein
VESKRSSSSTDGGFHSCRFFDALPGGDFAVTRCCKFGTEAAAGRFGMLLLRSNCLAKDKRFRSHASGVADLGHKPGFAGAG